MKKLVLEIRPPKFKEITSAEICKKNKWKKGTILEAQILNGSYFWKITAVGLHYVLGIRIDLPPLTTSREEIMPFHDSHIKWRKHVR